MKTVSVSKIMNFAFNELSENNLYSSQDLDKFYFKIKKLQALLDLKEFPSIVFNEDFTARDYNGNGTVYDLLKDTQLSKDERDHLLAIVVNAPHSYAFDHSEAEYLFQSKKTKGLQYACVNDIRCISIPGINWNSYQYTLEKLSLSPDADDVISCEVDVEHLGDLNRISGTWLENYLPETSFSCSKTFLDNIPKMNPDVILSPIAIQSIATFNKGKLNQLERIMGIFQEYCKKYWNSNFRYQDITKLGVAIKNESDRTMSKYSNQRVFPDENEKKYTFRLHFNISEDFRGYLKPTDDNKVFIGYLGPHLSTVKYK